MDCYGQRRRSQHSSHSCTRDSNYGAASSGIPLSARPACPHTNRSTGGCFVNFLVLVTLVTIFSYFFDEKTICNFTHGFPPPTCDLVENENVTKELKILSNQLLKLSDSFIKMEQKLVRLSNELPNLKEEIYALNELIDTDFIWDPKGSIRLPNVDVYLRNSNACCEIEG